jgi:hypothetical protein
LHPPSFPLTGGTQTPFVLQTFGDSQSLTLAHGEAQAAPTHLYAPHDCEVPSPKRAV